MIAKTSEEESARIAADDSIDGRVSALDSELEVEQASIDLRVSSEEVARAGADASASSLA